MSENQGGQTPAGWYPDTNQPGTLRYWDGNQWTEHTHQQSGAQASPGYQTYSPGMTQAPSNQLVPAILTTIFCCLPFGIVSIVKAAQVNNLWSSGQYDAARNAADSARKWWIASMAVGLGVSLLYIIFIFAVGVESSSDF